jgi:hypothetical protein
MEEHRKSWNTNQKRLRPILEKGEELAEAIQLFLDQHAFLHGSGVSKNDFYSYEDEILNDLSEEMFRRIRANDEHSIAWCIWHIARIEDVTMNMLVAGKPQLFHEQQWQDQLAITAVHTGNVMAEDEVRQLSDTVDFASLRAYRLAVGRKTREIVKELTFENLRQKVQADRLQKVVDERAVVHSALGLIDYWGKRTIAGLLLMPPTRHNFVHLNEASKLKSLR